MLRVSNKEFHCLHCNNCNTSRSTKILVRLILVNPFNSLRISRPHRNILPTAKVCLFRILYTINRLCQLSMLFLLPLGKICLQISNNMFRSLSRRCYHTKTYRPHGTCCSWASNILKNSDDDDDYDDLARLKLFCCIILIDALSRLFAID